MPISTLYFSHRRILCSNNRGVCCWGAFHIGAHFFYFKEVLSMGVLWGFIMFFICHTAFTVFACNLYCYIQEEKCEDKNQYAMKKYLITFLIALAIYIFVLVIALLVSPFANHKGGVLIGNGSGFITGSIHFRLMAEANYNKQKAKNNWDSWNYMSFEEKREALNQISTPVPTKQTHSGFLKNGHYKISQFIKEEQLHGRLEDIEVVIGESNISKYNKNDNNIYIGDKDNQSNESFINALLRCFQQAICVDSGILYSQTSYGKNDTEVSDEDLFDDLDESTIDFVKKLRELEQLSNTFDDKTETKDEQDDDSSEFDDNDLFDEISDDNIVEDEESDDESPMVGMFGAIRVHDEESFAQSQKNIFGCGFTPDFSFNKDKYEHLKQRKLHFDDLSPLEESKLIFPLIFGNFDCTINLDTALSQTTALLSCVMKEKPKNNFSRDNETYMRWLSDFAIPQILLGTIYTYQHEYIKAAYHFMVGLKTEQIPINMPYCDFIKYVLSKLPQYVPNEAKYIGCGFSPDNPMGSCGGNMLIAQNAMNIIPEMEGLKGEVIIARMGRTGLFGHLSRKGSTCGNNPEQPVDIYETFIIDSNFRASKIRFYINVYFNAFGNNVKIASGFKIKSHSALINQMNFIEE